MRPPRGLALVLGLALFAVGTIPYLLAPRHCPDAVFTGVLGNWPDTKQHLAFINHYEEALLLPNVLTNETQKPFMLNLLFWVGARIGLLFGGPLFGWHVLRLLGLCVFCFAATRAVWRFVVPGRRALALTLSLAPLSLALIPHLTGASSIDGNTIRYTFEQPQLPLSAGLAILAFLGTERFWDARGARMPWGAIGGVVALWLLHPFEFWAAGFVYTVACAEMIRKKELVKGGLRRALVGAVLMALPAGLFLYINHIGDGGLRALQKIHGDAWPQPWDLLNNLGLPLLIALPLLFGTIKSDGDARQNRVLGIWLLATWVSVYLPGAPWRWHMVNGLQVCVAVIALRAEFWQRVRPRAPLVLASLAASLLLHAPYLLELRQQATTCTLPAFNTRGVDAALTFLREQGATARILARPMLGLEVAMRTRGRPYYGTVRKTPGWQEKMANSNKLLDLDVGPGEGVVILAPLTHVLCQTTTDRACDDTTMDRLGMRRLFSSEEARVYGRAR